MAPPRARVRKDPAEHERAITADHYVTHAVLFGCQRHADAIVCVVLEPTNGHTGELLHVPGTAEASPHLIG